MATDMTPATNPLPPNPSIANRSIRQGSVASSQQSTTVSRQQTRTRNATQIENFVDEGEVQALLGLFEDQWSMWTRALEYESPAQARGALNQAAITRNMIRAMRSEEETDELCQYWNPISVLAEMDQEETTTGITDNDHVTVMPHTRSVRAPTEIMIDPATRVITPVPTNRPLVLWARQLSETSTTTPTRGGTSRTNTNERHLINNNKRTSSNNRTSSNQRSISINSNIIQCRYPPKISINSGIIQRHNQPRTSIKSTTKRLSIKIKPDQTIPPNRDGHHRGDRIRGDPMSTH
ncbi:hypothetical protein MJO29_000391 [Puccinia striiformis f. sp. tritici]|nr:hypothetical protein MJO29_000391 [Puccinia striiformis f. sp. tritici]